MNTSVTHAIDVGYRPRSGMFLYSSGESDGY